MGLTFLFADDFTREVGDGNVHMVVFAAQRIGNTVKLMQADIDPLQKTTAMLHASIRRVKRAQLWAVAACIVNVFAAAFNLFVIAYRFGWLSWLIG